MAKKRGWSAAAVRDSLRGIAPNDYDITTTLRPEQVMARFEHVVPTGIEHGTVTVLQDGCPIEVTTMRKEGTYRDHRHPGRGFLYPRYS